MSQQSGSKLSKSPNSTCVINLMLPRDISEPIQKIRTQNIPDARCGPHFSFLDPFVEFEHYKTAALLLQKGLANFQPFDMTLKKLNYFVHKGSCTVYLEPETNPPNAIELLMKKCLEIFPQCDDQLKKSTNNTYVAHMSIAKFKDEKEVKRNLPHLQEKIPTSTFKIDALFLLHRIGTDTFKCIYEIPFNNLQIEPRYGKNSPGDTGTKEQESQIGRSLVIGGIPKGLNNDQLLEIFESQNIKEIERIEVTLNPNGSSRNCGAVQFKNHDAALKCLKEFKKTSKFPEIYLNKMCEMMAPGLIGGSWSLESVQGRKSHLSPQKRKKENDPDSVLEQLK